MSSTQELPAWRVSAFVRTLMVAGLLVIAILNYESHQAGVWLTTSVLFCVGRTEIFVVPPDSRALTFFWALCE